MNYGKPSRNKIHRVGSRHTICIRKDLIDDSAFPFRVGEPLIIRIEEDKLVIVRKTTPSKPEREELQPSGRFNMNREKMKAKSLMFNVFCVFCQSMV